MVNGLDLQDRPNDSSDEPIVLVILNQAGNAAREIMVNSHPDKNLETCSNQEEPMPWSNWSDPKTFLLVQIDH
jgi:hypothetical protein